MSRSPKLGQLDDGRVCHHAHEGIGAVPRGLQFGQDGVDVFFDEQQVRHHQVRLVHRLLGGGKGGRVFRPFRGSMDRNLDAGKVLGQTRRDPHGGAGGMGVESDDDKAVGAGGFPRGHAERWVGFIAHNGPWPRKGSRS